MEEAQKPFSIPTLKVHLPSGHWVEIREQNGEDDDILSKSSYVQSHENVNRFLAGIIVNSSYNRPITEKDIKQWRVNDKYYLLLKSRIFSLGHELIFDYSCPKCKTKTQMVEDLSIFDADLDRDSENFIGKLLEKNPNSEELRNKIWPLEHNEPVRHLVLNSGKEVRYKFLTVASEHNAIKIPFGEQSRNKELIIRDFEMKVDGMWMSVQNFKLLSAKDMAQIRADVNKHDELFIMESHIKCPACNHEEVMPLIAIPDFFFPTSVS
jgi:hypothetical protein